MLLYGKIFSFIFERHTHTRRCSEAMWRDANACERKHEQRKRTERARDRFKFTFVISPFRFDTTKVWWRYFKFENNFLRIGGNAGTGETIAYSAFDIITTDTEVDCVLNSLLAMEILIFIVFRPLRAAAVALDSLVHTHDRRKNKRKLTFCPNECMLCVCVCTA